MTRACLLASQRQEGVAPPVAFGGGLTEGVVSTESTAVFEPERRAALAAAGVQGVEMEAAGVRRAVVAVLGEDTAAAAFGVVKVVRRWQTHHLSFAARDCQVLCCRVFATVWHLP